MLGVKWLG
ncbi:hypothetical protein CGLO_00231 [Colletotrichum gloeosporioides Cg-14]|uniref:Uncharacterized protein n=1 Tax=Colletotrichum gloeosporioides (strain Cg-14) TaxID=1237896 RepID=T0L3Q1_COLGC|nr:hypothetical protein CGLO_00231 [Colletotrichum gloeosporioides Cg-14]